MEFTFSVVTDPSVACLCTPCSPSDTIIKKDTNFPPRTLNTRTQLAVFLWAPVQQERQYCFRAENKGFIAEAGRSRSARGGGWQSVIIRPSRNVGTVLLNLQRSSRGDDHNRLGEAKLNTRDQLQRALLCKHGFLKVTDDFLVEITCRY